MAIRTFNTGRAYTEHGQRIAWVPTLRRADGKVVVIFHDLDRMITQIVAVEPPVSPSRVLDAYDACDYIRDMGWVSDELENDLKAAAEQAQKWRG